MIIINQIKAEIPWEKGNLSNKEMLLPVSALQKKAASILHIHENEIASCTIWKHSLDARKKPQILQVYSLGISLKKANQEAKKVQQCKNPNVILSEQVSYVLPKQGTKKADRPPVIVGMGPAGLFCGYMLAMQGYRPIILERGKDVDTRTADVEAFWKTGVLDVKSNVQFGEGGAGTFSDGKLNTLVKDKKGRNRKVLEIFVEAGAPEEILFEQKPHIGTDVLKEVMKNMRNRIMQAGGQVFFDSQVTALKIENGEICGVVVNEEKEISTGQVVLAIGHSARDTFAYLERQNISMEAKSFAVGMRVEHPQSVINEAMYGKEHGKQLPAAPYKLTAKTSVDRGVYSFCMCPGGYVVNASSEEGRIAVNGMSYSDRGSDNANSAIIVTVTPNDYGEEGPLAGVAFQRRLEEKAYEIGKGAIPVQYYEDYLQAVPSVEKETYHKPCIKGRYAYGNLRGLLPETCEKAFMEGMSHFERIIPGFAAKDAILSGVESRTSSPVRIHRDDTMQSPSVKGLYPCGEGAGYAGGITSAAMDGILIAEKIMERFAPFA